MVGPATRSAVPGLLPGVTRSFSVSENSASEDRRLTTGSLGGDVVDSQRVVRGLAAEGEVDTPRLSLDGVLGPATRAGPLAVQRRLGVEQDGIVGPVTRAGAVALLAAQ